MRPFTDTLPFTEALRLVMAAAVPIARTEILSLDDAAGRVIATDEVAPAHVPAFDRAAMDGYAVIATDTTDATSTAPRLLRQVGELFTGSDPASAPSITHARCVAIATGAPIPPGADAVVMVEQTRREGADVAVMTPATPGQHIVRRGSDLRAGDMIASAGTQLTPGRLGALASVGLDRVRVFGRPRVAIVSTGDEIVAPGHALAPGQIYDSNTFSIAAVVAAHGGEAVRLPGRGDTLDDLVASLRTAATHDIAVFSGGSSVGDRDLVRDAVRALGEVVFHGISIKPGKPTLFGRVDETPVLGLPGNPASCLTNAYLLLLPLLRATARLPRWRPEVIHLPLARAITSTAGRHQFYSVRIANGCVEPAFKGSGSITSLAHADGYIEIPATTESIAAGTMVAVTVLG